MRLELLNVSHRGGEPCCGEHSFGRRSERRRASNEDIPLPNLQDISGLSEGSNLDAPVECGVLTLIEEQVTVIRLRFLKAITLLGPQCPRTKKIQVVSAGTRYMSVGYRIAYDTQTAEPFFQAGPCKFAVLNTEFFQSQRIADDLVRCPTYYSGHQDSHPPLCRGFCRPCIVRR